jgi:catechol 2,3-dioxygenase-like lactoylglutathione lyase family enzyme
MRLEAIILGVADVDRSKAFYEKLGWRLDIDFSARRRWLSDTRDHEAASRARRT